MLQPGNTKLGSLVHTWSLLSVTTCPGKSSVCLAHCYAKGGHFYRDSVHACHEQNGVLAESPDFVDRMIEEIHRKHSKVVRIHVAGDFPNAAYVQKWIEIARHCPETIFYGYTRSWRVPEMRPVLDKLVREPNVTLWYSCDRETGKPPRNKALLAWMAENDEDVPSFPVDLVFRVSRKTPMKKDSKGNRVCNYERGQEGKVTCSNCKLCWRMKNVKVNQGISRRSHQRKPARSSYVH